MEFTAHWTSLTWCLFHTLAQQTHTPDFPIVGKELLEKIRTLCHNLACSMCTDHATEYFKTVDLDTIQTHEDLIDFFWKFHNNVNTTKEYDVTPHDIFPHDKLNIYRCFNVKQLFREIYIYFKKETIEELARSSPENPYEPYDTKYYKDLENFYDKNRNHFVVSKI